MAPGHRYHWPSFAVPEVRNPFKDRGYIIERRSTDDTDRVAFLVFHLLFPLLLNETFDIDKLISVTRCPFNKKEKIVIAIFRFEKRNKSQ